MPWSAPLIAVEFLTPLRLRHVERWDDRTFGASLGWFPAVGFGIGVLMLLLDRGLEHLLPGGPADALLLVALALVTGGLHLDGVADTADGLAVQGDRATRLGVMSEGNIGPAGVMSLALVLLVQWSALASLEPPLRSAAIVLAPGLARWSIAPVAALFPPARPRGIGHALQQGIWPSAAPVAAAFAFGASLALFGAAGLVLPLVAAVAALIVAAAVARMLEGVTGDTFGACIEISQAAVLLAFVAAGQHGWLCPTFLT
ncbi:MAG: adenosylcobinamide-GDP ribazoletransferase [Dehalococcoidia bacterium]